MKFEPLQIWGELGSHNIAIGPTAGGVAVAQIVTTDGTGIMTKQTAQRAANYARLMAAAPDLLEALKELLYAPDPDEVGDFTPRYRAILKANAAIAKVKGDN